MPKLAWTGERMVPEYQALGSIEHLHRYSMALELIKPGMTVLDAACGEGYGTNLISGYAEKVFGVDISKEAVEHAREKYQKKNIHFIEASAVKIPLDDKSIDLIISFETLEHLFEQEKLILEFKRLLKKDGIIIISTPDKEYYKEAGINHYHVKELYFKEFENLLNPYFNNVKFVFQKNVTGSYIFNKEANQKNIEFKGDFDHIETFNTIKEAQFCIAFASDADIVNINVSNSFFDAKSIYESEKQEYIEIVSSFNNVMHSKKFRIYNKLLKLFKMGFKF